MEAHQRKVETLLLDVQAQVLEIGIHLHHLEMRSRIEDCQYCSDDRQKRIQKIVQLRQMLGLAYSGIEKLKREGTDGKETPQIGSNGDGPAAGGGGVIAGS